MRYYEITLPGEREPRITSKVRGMRNLPEGTRIEAVVTDRDGSLMDSWEIDIVDGEPQILGSGKCRPQYGRF